MRFRCFFSRISLKLPNNEPKWLVPALAKGRKKVAADRVQVTHLDGVNHLLVPAKTGDLEEYPQLAVKTVDPRVAKTVVDWLASLKK